MIRQLTIWILLTAGSLSSAAQSLILNGGFEEENSCFEYHINCAPEAWLPTVPTFNYYYRDASLAHSGERCLVLVAGHERKPYYRSYSRTRLCCALQPKNQYLITLWVKSRYPLHDSLGLYFSRTDFLFEPRKSAVTPQLYFSQATTPPNLLDSNWQQVQLLYTATGEEHFLSIGNFCRRAVAGNSNVYMERNFFILFDDISMVPVNQAEKLCPDWQQQKEQIYAEDERHEYISKLMNFYKGKPVPDPAPLTATQFEPVPEPELFVLEDLLFTSGSAILSRGGEQKLTELCNRLMSKSIDSIVISGHTDSIGTTANNQALSLARAETVRTYLANRLILLPEQMPVYGFGALHPLAENQTALGRQRNRRVEISLYFRQVLDE